MRCVFALAVALLLPAQDSRFESRSRLVLVPVTVTGADGRVADGLDSSDFLVLDNGRGQKTAVDTIATGVAPIALAVVVQSSGISYAVLEKVQKIGGMIRPLILGERGCAELISFSERISTLQECTNDPELLEPAFHRLRTGMATRGRMVDAVNAAVQHLRGQPAARRVILLISESKDRGSETALASAIEAAQSAGVTVYAATYSAFTTAFTSKGGNNELGLRDPEAPAPDIDRTVDRAPSNEYDPKLIAPQNSLDLITGIGELARLHKTDTTQALTAATGGAKLPFARQKGLEDAIQKLGAELHSQYLLSFTPETGASGYHRLEVRVVRSGEFHVRARPGYWVGENPR